MIDFTYSHLLFGIAILAVILIHLRKQNRSFWYLLFFSVFWIYLLFVASVIVFPIAPLSKEHLFRPNLNLIPFYFGTCDMLWLCLQNVMGNIFLTMPFGFGISFVSRVKLKDVLRMSFLVGTVFELIQLVISFVFRSPFRAVDINDVILNATGVLLGYGVFRIFGWLYLYTTQRFAIHNKYIFAYIYDVVRQP
ncbi:MAG TPA: VanZ family protein [Anaerolineales bacterium]|nr:VanZ family protein [Anaerolineales bacterium]